MPIMARAVAGAGIAVIEISSRATPNLPVFWLAKRMVVVDFVAVNMKDS